MKIWKCALALALGLSVRAFAASDSSQPEYAYRIPADQVTAGRVYVSVDDLTGAVSFLDSGGQWQSGVHVNLLVPNRQLIHKTGWDGRYDDDWGRGCSCVVPQPPPPAYYYGRGYLYGGAYPRAPYYRPARVYHRVEQHDRIYEYERVSPPPPPPPPYYYPGPYYGE
jgi:hypothetical protein